MQKGLTSILIFGVISDPKVCPSFPLRAGEAKLMVFGCIGQLKDGTGSFATSDQSPVAKALKLCKMKYPDLLLMCDVCLCAYTEHGTACLSVSRSLATPSNAIEHRPLSLSVVGRCVMGAGHCGIVKSNGDIDNTPSIQRIAEVAVFYAKVRPFPLIRTDVI